MHMYQIIICRNLLQFCNLKKFAYAMHKILQKIDRTVSFVNRIYTKIFCTKFLE